MRLRFANRSTFPAGRVGLIGGDVGVVEGVCVELILEQDRTVNAERSIAPTQSPPSRASAPACNEPLEKRIGMCVTDGAAGARGRDRRGYVWFGLRDHRLQVLVERRMSTCVPPFGSSGRAAVLRFQPRSSLSLNHLLQDDACVFHPPSSRVKHVPSPRGAAQLTQREHVEQDRARHRKGRDQHGRVKP